MGGRSWAAGYRAPFWFCSGADTHHHWFLFLYVVAISFMACSFFNKIPQIPHAILTYYLLYFHDPSLPNRIVKVNSLTIISSEVEYRISYRKEFYVRCPGFVNSL
jgi:hypothetical protein